MMKNRVIIMMVGLIALLVVGEENAGAQTISGISRSNISNGDSITINGSEFGSKSVAAPMRFDDFEQPGINAGDSINDGGYWNANLASDVVYATDNQRASTSTKNVVDRLEYGGKNGKFTKNDAYSPSDRKIFVSFWSYVTTPVNNSTDRWQLKLWRISSGPEHGDWPTDNLQLWWNTDLSPYASYYEYLGTTSSGLHYHFTGVVQQKQWVYYQYGLLQSSSVDASDGEIHRIIISTGQQMSRQDNTDIVTRSFSYPNPMISLKFGYLITNGINEGHEVHTYWDDIYLDNSWARVQIGDNANYNQCSHLEMQIPSSWSDTSITLTVNQGSFNDSETAYLFVVDENSTVSDGYPITFCSSGETPPARSNPQPTGTLSSGTTSTNLSLTTNVQAVCRYSNISGTNYTDMTGTFTNTNSTSHSTQVTGLENGVNYTFYVRCNSSDGFVNTDDFNISFSVDGHKADLNEDGVINMPELIAFIARWKANDGVTRQEVEEARDIWFAGGVYYG